jgi:DNA-binding LytR/AlgR family response regulator
MQYTTKSANPYHPDITIFLISIPFINAINYYLTYTNIQLNGFFLLTFTLDTLQGYLGWWGARACILYLDKKIPYENNLGKRLLIQFITTTTVGLSIITLLTELVSWLARGRPAHISFYSVDLFIIGIWFFVINGIYAGLHFYNRWRESEWIRQEDQRLKTEGLNVRLGKEEVRLQFDDVAGLFVDEEYVAACHHNGKKYYVDQSLDKLEKKLPQTHFFRLNRKYILNRSSVLGFKRLDNGKLHVFIAQHPLLPSEITVSRLKAPSFKAWFRPE